MSAVSWARRRVGSSASRWARLATSGTTPPKRTCSATLDATSLANSSVPRTSPTPVSSQDDSIPRISGPLTTRPPRRSDWPSRAPGRQVPEPQDQRVPTRPVVVVTSRQLLEPEPLVEGDGRVVVPRDLEHHRARARVPDRLQAGADQGRADAPAAGARGDTTSRCRSATSPTVCSAITPTGTCIRASSVVRPSPSSSPCQLRSLHCSFGAKPATLQTHDPGQVVAPGGRDAHRGLGGAHRPPRRISTDLRRPGSAASGRRR